MEAFPDEPTCIIKKYFLRAVSYIIFIVFFFTLFVSPELINLFSNRRHISLSVRSQWAGEETGKRRTEKTRNCPITFLTECV